MGEITGIHHVTAIAGPPQPNVDFYTGVLGLRMVKLTVNFDDPGTYHLYFGDWLGRPGTAITFFPWAGAPAGRTGAGLFVATAFAIPESAYDYWITRLREQGVGISETERFGERVIELADPDGIKLELVASAKPQDVEPWARSPVPVDQAIRGFDAVTLCDRELEPAAELVGQVMGAQQVGEEGDRARFEFSHGGSGSRLDVVRRPEAPRGTMGVGVVHHVAWRVADEAAQEAARQRLIDAGHNVTPVKERQYFKSIYFRGPGGSVLEIATDGPGFDIDEPAEALGQTLRLPPWLEPQRATLEQTLPKLNVPKDE